MDSLYKKPKKEIYTLSNVIKCAACGEKFTSHMNSGHRYYRCTGYTKKRNCPSRSKSINASLIETIVFKKMVERCRNINFPAFEKKFNDKLKKDLISFHEKFNNVMKNIDQLNMFDCLDIYYDLKEKSAKLLEEQLNYNTVNSSFGHDNLAMHLEEFTQEDLKKFYKKEISIDFNVEKGEGVINFIYRDEEPITFSLKPVPQITSEKTSSLKE